MYTSMNNISPSKSQSTQTEDADIAAKCKTAVYDKVDNVKRCELIRILQEGGKSLRETAEQLGINYSTAKTIVQTFRREKRVAKKPKRFLETRKAIKKERYLQRVLSGSRVDAVISEVLEEEFMELLGKDKEEKKEPSVQGITKATQDFAEVNPPLTMNTGFHKVFSAPQMLLYEAEEEGPKENQVSRAIGVQEEHLLPINKKEVFYVYPERDLDEDYKEKIDYENPVILRTKPKSILEAKTILPSLNTLLKCELRKVQEDSDLEEKTPKIRFDFKEYGKAVIENSFKRTRSFPMLFNERTLAVPEKLRSEQERSLMTPAKKDLSNIN